MRVIVKNKSSRTHNISSDARYRKRMKKRLLPSGTVGKNIDMLIRELPMPIEDVARKSEISKRMIQYIIADQRQPTVTTAEAIAEAFGIAPWELLLPNLNAQLARSGKLNRLVRNYGAAPDQTRNYIDFVAERDAEKYGEEQ